MSDCKIGNRFPVATVAERLLLRSEISDEDGGGVAVGDGTKDEPAVLPPSPEAGVSGDRGSGVMDYLEDATRVSEGEGKDSVVARSSEDSSVLTRVQADGVFGAYETEAGDRTIECDRGGSFEADAGKGSQRSRLPMSKQPVAEIGSIVEGSEEDVEDNRKIKQTRVSLWHGARSEALEPAEARDSWMHGFEVGDLVWGKVKSHPWWPGHIFNEAFVSSSVRRTKREGHVLVAFFGDSSYGWFDPAELIPFGPHYAEKSKQTTSRNFTKAVEEAVDEANRRCALGLSCYCLNPSNFRPTTVRGYFVVDVAGYEPGGVYSSKQIKKARDDFVITDVLSFVNRLAVMPQDSEQGSIDLLQKTATLLALRKAMFEEFDVTYAEAFGVQPVLPSRATQGGSNQRENIPFRVAPLSGPLVIAESLGERKAASSKAVVRARGASSTKKNKYLFKRRDDAASSSGGLKSASSRTFAAIKQKRPSGAPGHAPDLQYAGQGRGTQPAADVRYIPHVQADVVVAAADGAYAADVENYVLQKRVPEKLQSGEAKQEAGGGPVVEIGGLSPESLDRAAEPSGRGQAPVQDGGVKKPEQPAGEEVGAQELQIHEVLGTKAPGVFADADVKPGFPQPDAEQGKADLEGVDFSVAPAHSAPSPMEVDTHHRKTGLPKAVDVVVVKKEKVRKHPPGELDGVEKKRKKRKIKEGGAEAGADHPKPKHKNEDSLRLSAGKSVGVGPSHPDGSSPPEPEIKVDAAHAATAFIPSDPAVLHQLPSLDLPGVLGDLSALALDLFYGAERNVSGVVRHVLLRFRSLVYEKALRSPPAGDHEVSEPPHAGRPRPPRPLPQEPSKDSAGAAREGEGRESTKPPKPPKTKRILKPDDPTKIGRKRLPSDRQEEKLAKRLKKLDKLKALASEKKAALVSKTSDGQPRGEQQRDAATATAVIPAKFPKADAVVKKHEAPAPPKVATPTYLVMKFPQRTTLPSISSLKARFARFGPLDLSGTRVFWKSYTCRVLFKHRSDAQAAHSYAQTNDIFGQVKVVYFLRDFEFPDGATPAAATTDSVKRPAADARPEDAPLQFRPASGADSAADLKPKHQTVYSGQLKSILKKSTGDEAAPVGKEAPRVKFMLGGEDGRGDPPVVVSSGNGGGGSSSNNNGGSNAGAGILPTTYPPLLDVNNSRKPPKAVTFLQPLQPPLRPPPPQDAPLVPLAPPMVPRAAPPPDAPGPRGAALFGRPSHHQARAGEAEARERGGVDISHQMLSLLARCSDIVTSVKSALGYVPYHPL